MPAQYLCRDPKRRQSVLSNPALNGLDFLDVLDQQAVALWSNPQVPPSQQIPPRQQTLLVRFLRPPPPLTLQNLRIEGGARITAVNAVWIFPASSGPSPPETAAEQAFYASLPDADRTLVIRTDSAGDFSTYTLRLVQSQADSSPPPTIDVRFASLDFSFKVECPSDFDCKPAVMPLAESPVVAP